MSEVYEVYDPVTGDVIELEGMVILDKDDFYLETDNENLEVGLTEEQAIFAAEEQYS